MRRVIAVGLCALLGATGALVVGGATPAGAGKCPDFPDADGRLRPEGGAFVGDGEYVFDTFLVALDPGESAEYVARWRNRKTNAKTIRVTALEQSSNLSAFRTRYFVHGAEVTTQLHGPGVTFDVAPGRSTPALTFRIRYRAQAAPGLQLFAESSGSYVKGQQCADEVSVQVKPA